MGPDLGLHVQADTFLVGVHLLLQLLLGHFQFCHLAGHPPLVQLLLTLPLSLLNLNKLDFGMIILSVW